MYTDVKDLVVEYLDGNREKLQKTYYNVIEFKYNSSYESLYIKHIEDGEIFEVNLDWARIKKEYIVSTDFDDNGKAIENDYMGTIVKSKRRKKRR